MIYIYPALDEILITKKKKGGEGGGIYQFSITLTNRKD